MQLPVDGAVTSDAVHAVQSDEEMLAPRNA